MIYEGIIPTPVTYKKICC